ncbi:MAG TPA: phosphate ABC transporter permease subunit PstC [Fimbriimonadaceae bacterium]|nr:phosphate ABC transporter permease subunit PstC [Fimbriimonadaceae bacterium]
MAMTGQTVRDRPVELSRAKGSNRLGETGIRLVCLLCALISVLTTFGIIFILVRESIHFFGKVSPVEFLTSKEWAPGNDKFGILPLAGGTFLITLGAGIIALPLGLLSGLYLSEYASSRVRKILKPALEILAGIPTVVYGFFALTVVTPYLKSIFPQTGAFNAASGAIVVGIMILPLVSSLCEDALSAVPKSLREGAYGLGATKFEVSAKIVVPAALSGIMASFILALSRAIGETMAVTLAAGATPKLTANPLESIQTMTAYIVQIAKGDAPAGSTQYYTLFAVGLTLFAVTMLMNVFALRLVKRFRQVYN